jgi:hypothetical protein
VVKEVVPPSNNELDFRVPMACQVRSDVVLPKRRRIRTKQEEVVPSHVPLPANELDLGIPIACQVRFAVVLPKQEEQEQEEVVPGRVPLHNRCSTQLNIISGTGRIKSENHK